MAHSQLLRVRRYAAASKMGCNCKRTPNQVVHSAAYAGAAMRGLCAANVVCANIGEIWDGKTHPLLRQAWKVDLTARVMPDRLERRG